MCPQWNDNNNDIKTYEIYFTHNCCTKYGPAHESTAKLIGNFDNVLHYKYSNISSSFKYLNNDIISIELNTNNWTLAFLHNHNLVGQVIYIDLGFSYHPFVSTQFHGSEYKLI